MNIIARRPLARLVGALALVVSMPAQIESARWWRSPQFGSALNLSTGQADTIEQIYRESLPALRARAKEAEAAHARLERVFVKDASDVVTEQAITEMLHADAARRREHMLMLCRILHLLSPAQRSRLRAIDLQRGARFGSG